MQMGRIGRQAGRHLALKCACAAVASVRNHEAMAVQGDDRASVVTCSSSRRPAA